jgi:acyl-CoA thioesterase
MRWPASIACHYLTVPEFAPVHISIESLQRTKRAESLRVSIRQSEKLILEAKIWAVAERLPGPTRAWIPAPPAPPVEDTPTIELGGGYWSAASFFRNVEVRQIYPALGTATRALDATVRTWSRLTPRATYENNLWLDAARAVLHIDAVQFAAVANGFEQLDFIAPSLDLYVAFHDAAPEQTYMLVEAQGLAAAHGTVAGSARVWASDGRLLATGTQQMLCRPFAFG